MKPDKGSSGGEQNPYIEKFMNMFLCTEFQ
jgi:hypothetical protein